MADLSKYTSSSVVLIAANLVPLFGVLFLDWDAFSIVLLYWVENVIIGAINVLKMATCSPDPAEFDLTKLKAQMTDAQRKAFVKQASGYLDHAKVAHHASKLFLIPFFTFHYGFFCMIHGMFVFVMFDRDTFFGPFEFLRAFVQTSVDEHLLWAMAALAASHLFSFFVNYLGHGEYRRTIVPLLMIQPYGRVVVLHIAILFGGFVTMAFGSPMALLLLLIAGKTMLDLKFHLRERERNSAKQVDGLPETILADS